MACKIQNLPPLDTEVDSPESTKQTDDKSKHAIHKDCHNSVSFLKIELKLACKCDIVSTKMASVFFDESDFDPVSKDDLCQAPDCLETRGELSRLLLSANSTIRLRVYLCFYCLFENVDRGAMRGHFREAHAIHGQEVDEEEGGENCEVEQSNREPTRIRLLKETSAEEEEPMKMEEKDGDDWNPEHGGSEFEDSDDGAGLSEPCNEDLEVELNEEGIQDVDVLDLSSGMRFKDWASFEAHFDSWKYQNLTHTYKKDSRLNKAENKDTHKYTSVGIKCVHYGEPRLRETKQIRKNQSYMAVGCLFALSVKLDVIKNEYYIDKVHLQHRNHEVTQDAFRKHPQARKLNEPQVARFVTDNLIDLKATKAKVKEVEMDKAKRKRIANFRGTRRDQG